MRLTLTATSASRFILSSAETLYAAELQLEAADGIKETPFVTLRTSLDTETGQPFVEAYQVIIELINEASPKPDSSRSYIHAPLLWHR
jgi:hypothetical protein